MLSTVSSLVWFLSGSESSVRKNKKILLSTAASLDVALAAIFMVATTVTVALMIVARRDLCAQRLEIFKRIHPALPISLTAISVGQLILAPLVLGIILCCPNTHTHSAKSTQITLDGSSLIVDDQKAQDTLEDLQYNLQLSTNLVDLLTVLKEEISLLSEERVGQGDVAVTSAKLNESIDKEKLFREALLESAPQFEKLLNEAPEIMKSYSKSNPKKYKKIEKEYNDSYAASLEILDKIKKLNQ